MAELRDIKDFPIKELLTDLVEAAQDAKICEIALGLSGPDHSYLFIDREKTDDRRSENLLQVGLIEIEIERRETERLYLVEHCIGDGEDNE